MLRRDRSSNQNLLVGAILVGLAAALAWRHRGRIRDTAEPWLDGAVERLPWRKAAPPPPPTVH